MPRPQLKTAVLLFRKALGQNWSKATKKQVKRAYRKLALQHHPDRGGNTDLFAALAQVHSQIEQRGISRLTDSGGSGFFEMPPNEWGVWKDFARKTGVKQLFFNTTRFRKIIIGTSGYVLKDAEKAFSKKKRFPVFDTYGGSFWKHVRSEIIKVFPSSMNTETSTKIFDQFFVIGPEFGLVQLDAKILLKGFTVSEKAFIGKLKRQLSRVGGTWSHTLREGVGEFREKGGKVRTEEVYLFGSEEDKTALVGTGLLNKFKWIPNSRLATQKKVFTKLLKDHWVYGEILNPERKYFSGITLRDGAEKKLPRDYLLYVLKEWRKKHKEKLEKGQYFWFETDRSFPNHQSSLYSIFPFDVWTSSSKAYKAMIDSLKELRKKKISKKLSKRRKKQLVSKFIKHLVEQATWGKKSGGIQEQSQ